MAGFRKAKAEQAALKFGLYGPPGSGKTFTALLMAEGLAARDKKRVAFVDTERGTDFYCQAVKTRQVHPEAFDFDAVYTRSITELLAALKAVDQTYSVIVIDSITHFWEAAMAAFAGKLTKVGTIPFHAWGKIKKPYKDAMSILLSCSQHVIICGRQKNVYSEDEETEELHMVGVTMRAEGETPYEPHILIRMEAIRPAKTNEIGQVVAYAEKDRTGVLAGRSFINPTFASLCAPLLGLLGGQQAQMPTTEETASHDAEKLAEQDRDRASKSAEIYRNFAARLTLSASSADLKKIGQEITPQVKAQMTPEDVANLRERYLERETELGPKGRPSQPSTGSDGEMPLVPEFKLEDPTQPLLSKEPALKDKPSKTEPIS